MDHASDDSGSASASRLVASRANASASPARVVKIFSAASLAAVRDASRHSNSRTLPSNARMVSSRVDTSSSLASRRRLSFSSALAAAASASSFSPIARASAASRSKTRARRSNISRAASPSLFIARDASLCLGTRLGLSDSGCGASLGVASQYMTSLRFHCISPRVAVHVHYVRVTAFTPSLARRIDGWNNDTDVVVVVSQGKSDERLSQRIIPSSSPRAGSPPRVYSRAVSRASPPFSPPPP